MISFKTTGCLLHSARLVLWIPIAINVVILTLKLGGSGWNGFILGISLCMLASFGFLINDLRDLSVDRINNAGKLENADRTTLRFASCLAGLFLAIGMMGGLFLGLNALIPLILIAVGLIAYTTIVRPRLVAANILAAALASAPLWLPNVFLGQQPNLAQWAILSGAMAILLGREIIFDVGDVVGDRNQRRSTLPAVLGEIVAARIGVVLEIAGLILFATYFIVEFPSISVISQLAMLAVLIGFGSLIVPVNLKLFFRPKKEVILNEFTTCTRLAMLLIPIFILLG
jgi:4-hydroxybenzoate polyprenyltransferase